MPQHQDAFLLRAPGHAGSIQVTCEECRDLETHAFRSPTDMIHALQVAAAEVDRGVLTRIDREELTDVEREAVESAFASEALPDTVRYRFKCTVCGDRFELRGETYAGKGGWTREDPLADLPGA